MNITINEIKQNDRAREDFGDLDELAESIARLGLIHPISLGPDKTLIAGGRRYAALSKMFTNRKSFLQREDLDVSTRSFLDSGVLQLGKHYTSKEAASVDLLDEMELEENVRRKSFNWKEQIHAVAKIHLRKKQRAARDGDKWDLKQTGDLLGLSHAPVSYALKLHTCLKDPDHPIQKCSSATDALHLLTKMRADEARRLAVARSITDGQPKTPVKKRKTGVELTLDDIAQEFTGSSKAEDFSALLAVGSGRNVATMDSDGAIDKSTHIISLSNSIFHGDFLERLSVLPPVHHIITDPPYGIEMANLQMESGDGVRNLDLIKETHQVVDNVANFMPWLQACYNWLPESGWLIMFCDPTHWARLHSFAEEVGFKAQRWPFIWCKLHACMNQSPDFNFTKNFEFALIARKGAATLIKPQASSYMQASVLPTKKVMPAHPFVKPFELWQHLAKAIAIEGETIGDPFSGVGSMPRAVAEIGYKYVTCEINEDLYNAQIMEMRKFYSEKFENVEFV